MRRWRQRLLVVVGVAAAAGALLATTFASCPLPEPPALDVALPAASPPGEMSIVQLPTGGTHRSAGFAYRGGSWSDKRDFAMTAVLVQHPKGDVLIDTGLGADIDRQLELMPAWFRLTTSFTAATPAAAQLDAAGYDRRRLRGIVLTHAHWDHASGLGEFPNVPVLVPEAERIFIESGGWITAVARSATGVHFEAYAFDGPSYLGFEASYDLHGDGAVVIVPAPGHTPGSVIVFVSLPSGTRYMFLGDLVWQLEGITEREERPLIQRTLADSDPEAVRQLIGKVAAIASRFPEMKLVPAHDARGFDGIPPL